MSCITYVHLTVCNENYVHVLYNSMMDSNCAALQKCPELSFPAIAPSPQLRSTVMEVIRHAESIVEWFLWMIEHTNRSLDNSKQRFAHRGLYQAFIVCFEYQVTCWCARSSKGTILIQLRSTLHSRPVLPELRLTPCSNPCDVCRATTRQVAPPHISKSSHTYMNSHTPHQI